MKLLSKKIRTLYYIISAFLITASLCIIFFLKPNIGIDFSGGILAEYKFNQDTQKEVIIDSINQLDFINSQKVQQVDQNSYLIRLNSLNEQQIDIFHSQINDKVGDYEEIRFENVGPTISTDITRKAIIAVIIASLAIILYIAYAFRSVPKPANSWRFGLTAILALVHDLIITFGVFVLIGYFTGYELDSLFIVAMLTILGYSVNDTIVVYDRIRENLKKYPNKSFEENVNNSLTQTIARSLNTSITLILVLLSLLLLGGESIRHFIILLLTGSIVGTYSSLFFAPPLLISWQNKSIKK